jgi:hypothetical protein
MQYEFEDLHKFQYQALFFFPLSFSSKFLSGLICLTSKAAAHDVTSVVDAITLVIVGPSSEI